MLSKWFSIEKNFEKNYKIFDVYSVKKEHQSSGKQAEYVLIESPDFANIIPVTENNEIVLVRQFRHGIGDFTLELPGGLVAPDEMPHIAAERECLEETGYSSDEPSIWLGQSHPNPAFMNNVCNSYIWFNCKKTHEQNTDGNEEIEVITVPLNDLKKLFVNKEFTNSIILNAFLFYSIKYGL